MITAHSLVLFMRLIYVAERYEAIEEIVSCSWCLLRPAIEKACNYVRGTNSTFELMMLAVFKGERRLERKKYRVQVNSQLVNKLHESATWMGKWADDMVKRLQGWSYCRKSWNDIFQTFIGHKKATLIQRGSHLLSTTLSDNLPFDSSS